MAVAAPAKWLGDGRAVDVLLTGTIRKGDVLLADGWLGIANSAGDSGDTISLSEAQEEWVFDVGASLSVAKGDIVYVTIASLTGQQPTLAGYSTSSGAGKYRLFKAVTAKDSNNFVRGILLGGLYTL